MLSLSLMHLYIIYLTLLWAFLRCLTLSEALCGYVSLNKCVFNCFLNKSIVAAFLIAPGRAFKYMGLHSER